MAKGRSGLSLGEYAVLGVLRAGSMHGYEVTRHFGPERDLALVLPLEMSAIYAMLKDLQEQGLLEGRREVVGLRPPRTVFQLTAEAEALFLDWLVEPVNRLREVRSTLLVKLFFCRSLSVALTRQLLDATNIDRLNVGEVKTVALNWLQPHEGNIIDFLYRNRAFQNSPPPPH